jgi:hypothetical protein
MRRPPLGTTFLVFVVLAVGFWLGAKYGHQTALASPVRLTQALEQVAAAQASLALLERGKAVELERWWLNAMVNGIAAAHGELESGARLEGEALPNLTEALRRALARLERRNDQAEAVARAREVLVRLGG